MLNRILMGVLLLLSGVSFAADQKPLVINPTTGKQEQLQAGNTLQLTAPTASVATMNLPHGTAPTTPDNGDLWTTTAGFFGRVNGVTVGPFGSGGGGGITGTLVSGRVPFANSASSVTDSGKFVFSATTGLSVNMASSGANNVTIGTGAGDSLSSGIDNVIIGDDAGTSVTTQQKVVIIGRNASLNGGTHTVAVGDSALRNVTTNENTAVGSQALSELTSGTNSTAMGYAALSASETGINNTAFGHRALDSSGGSNVTAMGASAGASNSYSNSIFLGSFAGDSTPDGSTGRFIVGSGTAPTTDIFMGKGETHTTPGNITITTTGGSGTNVAGGSVAIAGGRGTGNAAGGSVIIATAPAGGSGTTLNALVSRVTVDQTGLTTFTAPSTANATISLPHGTAPTSPSNGNTWTTTAGEYQRINGYTVSPIVGYWSTGADDDTRVVNTVTPTNILPTGVGTKTLPAGTMRVGTVMKICAWGRMSTRATATSVQIDTILGGVTSDILLDALPTSGEFRWNLEMEIIISSLGSSQGIVGQSRMNICDRTGSTAPITALNYFSQDFTGTVNTTIAQTASMTITWANADVLNEMELNGAYITTLQTGP